MNLQKLFKDTFTVTLEPVTPVHVWSGKDAAVGVDAIIHKDELILVDIEDTLKKIPEDLLESFVELSRSVGSTKALTNLLEKLKSRGLISGLKISVQTEPEIAPRSGVVKVQHEYVVPGSELKGYIRTGIIKKRLIESRNASEIIEKGVDLGGEAKNAGIGVEAQLLRKWRPKTQRGFIDALSYISVSDPLEYINVKMHLRELIVFHIPDLSRVATLYAVTFSEGRLKYRVTISTTKKFGFYSKHPERYVKELEEITAEIDKLVNTMGNRSWLLSALRDFGCDLIKIELDKLKEVRSRGHVELMKYEELLKKLKGDLCDSSTHCVPARIGFMAGHESKTIIPEVKRYTPKIYDEIRASMEQRLKRTWDARTLKLTKVNGDLVGIGWCKLCIE
ncbi:MAG: type III-A CRISPR-associated RAMP protein Csm5 [Sulfolobales archaeon]